MVEDGKTGIIVPPGDVGALASFLSKMVDHREAALSMGREGYERLKRQFSMDVVSARLIGLYQEMLTT